MSTNLQGDKTKQTRLNAKLHKKVKLLAAIEDKTVLFLVNKFVEKGLENFGKDFWKLKKKNKE